MNAYHVIILGAGGHAKVLAEILRVTGRRMAGVTTPETERKGDVFCGALILGGDEVLREFKLDQVELVNGIGFVADPMRRVSVFARGKAAGFAFATLVHPSAVIPPDCELGEGVQVMAGAVLQPGTSVGADTIINTRAGVDHDCSLGAHVHVGPGAILCGGVTIGDTTLVGASATVLEGVRIGRNCVIGGGALVRTDVAEGVTVAGVPARVVIRQKQS